MARRSAYLTLVAVAASAVLASTAAPAAAAPDLVPSRGALLGAYVDLNSSWNGNEEAKDEVRRVEQDLGRGLDINHHYYSIENVFPSGLEQWDVANGRIPMITWEFWGTTLAAVNAGAHDAVIRDRARNLRDFGEPVFLRWGHEMNSDWYPWSGALNGVTSGPGRFVTAWRRLHDIFEAQGASNVVWVWSPNSESIPNTTWNQVSSYYPGDAYVDWVGIDGYNFGTSRTWSRWRNTAGIFRDVYRDYASRKPIMLAEVGSAEQGGDKAKWIADMWYQLQVRMPKVKAVVWFDTDEWKYDTSGASASKFRRMAGSPHFRQRRDGASPRVAGPNADRNVIVRSTRIGYGVSEPSRVIVRVTNSSGDQVRILRRRGWIAPHKRSVAWDGRNSKGARVRRGEYRVVVTALDQAGNSARAVDRVTVR